jgi:uncharacterized membrane protein
MTLLEIKADRRRDPDGRQMRELLAAIANVERFGALRSVAFHGLAVIGVALWLAVAFPVVVPEQIRHFAVAGFVAVAAGAVAALVLELRWQKVQKRCMGANDVKVLDDEGE